MPRRNIIGGIVASNQAPIFPEPQFPIVSYTADVEMLDFFAPATAPVPLPASIWFFCAACSSLAARRLATSS